LLNKACCQFTENQVLANIDYLASPKSLFAGRFFLSNDSDIVTFSGNGLSPSDNVPGFQRARYNVEALFAEIEQQIKLRRVWLRRLWNVSEQFHLAATATKVKKAGASPHAKAVTGSQHCVKVPIEETVFFTQADFSTDSTGISIAGNLSISRAQWRCLWRWADRRRRWFELREQLENLANSRSLPAGPGRRIILLSPSTGKANREVARQLQTSNVSLSLWRT